jgi:hypothetical protein
LLAADENVAVGRYGEIERAELRILDQPGSHTASVRPEREDGVVPHPVRADAGGEKESAVASEGKSAWKRHNPGGKNVLAGGVQRGWKGDDRACCARADAIAGVWIEVAATWVQPFDVAGVANDLPLPIERKDAIGAAVEEEQSLVGMNAEPAGIGDAAVVAENAKRPALEIEGEERAVSVAIGAGCW